MIKVYMFLIKNNNGNLIIKFEINNVKLKDNLNEK